LAVRLPGAPILHNVCYGLGLRLCAGVVRHDHNATLCNLGWQMFLAGASFCLQRWQHLFTFLKYILLTMNSF
jgi:hypothetical protein